MEPDADKIAGSQRNLLVAYATYIVLALLQARLEGSNYELVVGILLILSVLAVVITCALLAFRIFGKPVATLLTALSIIPLVNLIVLLIVNGKATKTLRENGYTVGFFGAKKQG